MAWAEEEEVEHVHDTAAKSEQCHNEELSMGLRERYEFRDTHLIRGPDTDHWTTDQENGAVLQNQSMDVHRNKKKLPEYEVLSADEKTRLNESRERRRECAVTHARRPYRSNHRVPIKAEMNVAMPMP